MKAYFKFLCLVAGLFCFWLACQDTPGNYTRTQERDTLTYSIDDMTGPGGEVSPAALRVIPGSSWRFWKLSDSTFAIMSQDSSNGLESIIREDSLFAWFMTKLPDSLDLTSYTDTLRVSNDTLYISGQATGFYIGSSPGKKSATYTIATSASGDSADYYTDGTADQVQLQAAIDAMPSEGGLILLREGQYNFSASANITGSSGSGAKKIRISGTVGTVISIANGVNGINYNTTITTGFGNNQDFVVEGIRFEGLSDDANAIYIEDAHIVQIRNNVFVGDSLTAISMKRANNVKMSGNFFNRVKYGVYGIGGSVLGDDLEDIAIIGNDFSYCGRSAIHLTSTSPSWQRQVSNIQIVGNNIEESDYDQKYTYAIYLQNCKGASITANSITQTYKGGAIHLDDGSLNVISSNILRENGLGQSGSDSTTTIMMTASDSNLVIGNTLSNENTDYGFTLRSGSEGNIFIGNLSQLDSASTYRFFGGSGNVVWYNGGSGGGGSFDASANITFTGNNNHTGTETFTGTDRLSIENDGVNGAYFEIESAHSAVNAAGIKTYAHAGTIASPSATLSGQFIGLWSARGVTGSTLLPSAAAYLGFAAHSNWAGGDTPTRALIATTPDGSGTAAVRLYIDHDGDVTLGSSVPTTSARLDITGTSGGLLLPRLTTTQRNTLTGTAGLMIFNTTLDSVQCYTTAGWRSL